MNFKITVMSVLQTLQERSNNTCELCISTEDLKQYTIPPSLNENVSNDVLVCKSCLDQIEEHEDMDPNHWRCLNDSIKRFKLWLGECFKDFVTKAGRKTY